MGGNRVERTVNQGRLARTGNAGHTCHQSNRNFQVSVFQVVANAARQFQHPLFVHRCSLLRQGDLPGAGKVLASQRISITHDLLRCTLGNNGTAMHTRSRTNVDDMVSGSNGVFIVFYDDNRIPQILSRVRVFSKRSLSR